MKLVTSQLLDADPSATLTPCCSWNLHTPFQLRITTLPLTLGTGNTGVTWLITSDRRTPLTDLCLLQLLSKLIIYDVTTAIWCHLTIQTVLHQTITLFPPASNFFITVFLLSHLLIKGGCGIIIRQDSLAELMFTICLLPFQHPLYITIFVAALVTIVELHQGGQLNGFNFVDRFFNFPLQFFIILAIFSGCYFIRGLFRFTKSWLWQYLFHPSHRREQDLELHVVAQASELGHTSATTLSPTVAQLPFRRQ